MKIELRYKLINQNQVEVVILNENEYFDPILEQENIEDDAIPKYNDTRDYHPQINKNIFEWDELIISNSKYSDKQIRTEYYANGESQLIYRKDLDGYELIIQSIIISNNEVFVSRMERAGINKQWKPINISLGVDYKSFGKEKWYNLKKGELKPQM